MSLWRQLSYGVRNLIERERRNEETAKELEHFLDMTVEERVRSGESRQDAMRSARIELGSLSSAKDTAHIAVVTLGNRFFQLPRSIRAFH